MRRGVETSEDDSVQPIFTVAIIIPDWVSGILRHSFGVGTQSLVVNWCSTQKGNQLTF